MLTRAPIGLAGHVHCQSRSHGHAQVARTRQGLGKPSPRRWLAYETKGQVTAWVCPSPAPAELRAREGLRKVSPLGKAQVLFRVLKIVHLYAWACPIGPNNVLGHTSAVARPINSLGVSNRARSSTKQGRRKMGSRGRSCSLIQKHGGGSFFFSPKSCGGPARVSFSKSPISPEVSGITSARQFDIKVLQGR